MLHIHTLCTEAHFYQFDRKKKDPVSHYNEKLFQNNDFVFENRETFLK